MDIHLQQTHETLSFAKDQLVRYLTRMSAGDETLLPEHVELGVCEPLELVKLGLEDAEKLNDPKLDDAYVIEITHAKGFIYGSNARSVLLGVYRYLTEIGCRFLRPGHEYEFVPVKKSAEEFEASLAHVASMRHRGICIEGADSVENVLETIDWLPKVRYNSFFLQFKYSHEFLRRWYEHVGNPLLTGQEWSVEASIAADALFDKAMKTRSILQHRVGHGWTGEAMGLENYGWEAGETVPEEVQKLLAEVNGKRELIGGRPTYTNLCYTNPEVIDRLTDCVVRYAKAHPDCDYVHVWLADLPNHVCECENCRKKSLTDQYVHLLNVLDQKLEAEQLPTRIVFLLYQELLWAPETETLEKPDRFVLMFAPISRTFRKSYKDALELPEVAPYVPNHVVLPHTMEENMAHLKAWQDKVSCDSFVYDYHLGKCHYGDPGYVYMSRIIAEDMKANASIGLRGFNSCQELRAAFPNMLPNYIMGLIGEDTSLDFDETANDYYYYAYGERWAEVLDYLTRLSELYDSDYVVGYRPALDEDMAERMERATELIEDFKPIIDVTLERDLDPLKRRFWKALKDHAVYARLLTKALMERAKGNDEAASEFYREFCGFVREIEPEVQKALDGYRVLEVTRNYTKLKE